MKSFNLDTYLVDSFYLQYPSDIEVTSINYNSKNVSKNSIFVAIKGFKVDGNDYIDEAVKNGASIIVSEILPKKTYKKVGYLIVKDARNSLSILSQVLYNFPDKKLKLIGITGTDGKTSTAFYTYKLLKQLNYNVALICTTNIDIGEKLQQSPYRQSTPDANILFSLLDKCVKNKMEYVIIEATSHALSKKFNRLAFIEFDAAIITTITSEHLDFHKTKENYIQTKLSIINRLKDNGFLISTQKNKELNNTINRAKSLDKDYYILEKEIQYNIIENDILSLISFFYNKKKYVSNIYFETLFSNALLSILTINKLLNIKIETLLEKLEFISEIKGRFNIIENSINRLIIVDFAHTSDSFEKILSYLSKSNRNIITLFGCGGERDKAKRYNMGKIAQIYSNVIILSEEDPRFEDKNIIMGDIAKGILSQKKDAKYYCINDRKLAINKALKISKENDILLFLGKGHEKSIERNGKKIFYDEIKIIKEELNKIYE